MTTHKKVCSVDGCTKIVESVGLCAMHYTRWKRHGDFELHYISSDRSLRLWSKVDVRGADECWPWLGNLNIGYGRLVVDRVTYLTHRLSYELTFGKIPVGLQIDHVCHNASTDCPGGLCSHRRCCNPSHLRAVSIAENVLAGVGTSARNARKTHCLRGHPFTDDNTYVPPGGPNARMCRLCMRNRYLRGIGRREEVYSKDS